VDQLQESTVVIPTLSYVTRLVFDIVGVHFGHYDLKMSIIEYFLFTHC